MTEKDFKNDAGTGAGEAISAVKSMQIQQQKENNLRGYWLDLVEEKEGIFCYRYKLNPKILFFENKNSGTFYFDQSVFDFHKHNQIFKSIIDITDYVIEKMVYIIIEINGIKYKHDFKHSVGPRMIFSKELNPTSIVFWGSEIIAQTDKEKAESILLNIVRALNENIVNVPCHIKIEI